MHFEDIAQSLYPDQARIEILLQVLQGVRENYDAIMSCLVRQVGGCESPGNNTITTSHVDFSGLVDNLE